MARYEPGGHFAPHCDGTLRLGEDSISVYTIMAYLSGHPAFTGGEVSTGHFDTKLGFQLCLSA